MAPDGPSKTFKLHKGVKSHNGREMVAEAHQTQVLAHHRSEDVRASGHFATIQPIDTPDTLTVKLSISKPYAALLLAPTHLEMAIVPEEEVEKQGGNLSKQMVGSSPFKFVERVTDVHVKLVRNNDYWKPGIPYLNDIYFKPITDQCVRLTNLKAGEIDVLQDIHPKEVDGLKRDKPIIRGGVS